MALSGYKGDGAKTYMEKAAARAQGELAIERDGGALLGIITRGVSLGDALDDQDYALPRHGLARRRRFSGSGSAVVSARARHDAAVGQRHAAGIDEVRPVLRAIAVDDDRVAELDIAFAEALARQRSRRARFAGPLRRRAALVLRVEIEVRMRVRPLDLRQGAGEADNLLCIELGGK